MEIPFDNDILFILVLISQVIIQPDLFYSTRHDWNSPLHLYKSLSNSSATVFSNLLTKVFSCSPVCPDVATATLYFCSRSTSLFCNLTYSWRNRLRCRSSLATWPTSINKSTECNKKTTSVLDTETQQLTPHTHTHTPPSWPLMAKSYCWQMSRVFSFFCAVLVVDYWSVTAAHGRDVGTKDDLTAITSPVKILNHARNIDSCIIECVHESRDDKRVLIP